MTWAMSERGYSQRRACGLVHIDPCVYGYRSIRLDDAALQSRLRDLAAERRHFGYRRLPLPLQRESLAVNWKKLYRLYREEGLIVRKRGGRKRAHGHPQGPNQRWSLDFVSDGLACGRRFRVLCVIDDFSREYLAAVVDTSRQESVSRENSIGSSRCAASPAWWSATTADLQRHFEVAEGAPRRMAVHWTRKAHAEQLCGIFHRPHAR